MVTFAGLNDGDVPLLVANTDDLSGSGSTVVTEIKGAGLAMHVIVDDLEEGKYYYARVAAANGVGRGAWTEAPSPRRARSVPLAPSATVQSLSNLSLIHI